MPTKHVVQSVNEPTKGTTITIPSFSQFAKYYNPMLVVCLVVASFFLGSYYTKSQLLEKVGQQGTGTTPQQAAQQPQQPTKIQVSQDQIKALFTDKNITFGDKNSKTLLVEVADPSCPYCHVAAGHNPELNKQVGAQFTLEADGGTYIPPVPKMKELVDSGKAAFVWLYTNGHGNGEMGTKAMYCAHEKGNFWPVHDKLMTSSGYEILNNTVKNDKTKAPDLANFLSDATDAAALQTCLESGKYDAKLAQDSAAASSLGVNGTPGFFVNTTNFAGAYSWKDMATAIQ